MSLSDLPRVIHTTPLNAHTYLDLEVPVPYYSEENEIELIPGR